MTPFSAAPAKRVLDRSAARTIAPRSRNGVILRLHDWKAGYA
jgi:hypothetical protein